MYSFDQNSNGGAFILNVWETGMEHPLSEVNVFADIIVERGTHF